jgi:flagellar motor component MotA
MLVQSCAAIAAMSRQQPTMGRALAAAMCATLTGALPAGWRTAAETVR